MDLRNVGILPQHSTASQPRRPGLEIWCLNKRDASKEAVKPSHFFLLLG
jgi:hypothetical protein